MTLVLGTWSGDAVSTLINTLELATQELHAWSDSRDWSSEDRYLLSEACERVADAILIAKGVLPGESRLLAETILNIDGFDADGEPRFHDEIPISDTVCPSRT